MEFGKRYPLVRVYFNKRNDWPLVWSVDDGDQKNEINVNHATFNDFGRTVYSGDPVSETSPVAWIEFYDQTLLPYGTGVVIEPWL
jgi:hypothetical protein